MFELSFLLDSQIKKKKLIRQIRIVWNSLAVAIISPIVGRYVSTSTKIIEKKKRCSPVKFDAGDELQTF